MCFIFRNLFCLLLLVLFAGQVIANDEKLKNCLEKAKAPLAKMECFRGLPYRVDGALDERWRWTSWADQSQEFESAGLNCSGLTFAISGSIFGRSLSLDEAKLDRLNDSGVDAPMGEDWDFGLDLILNLTEGMPRRLVPDPYENRNVDSQLWSAADLRGIDVDSIEFENMLSSLLPDRIYYVTVSKADSKFKGGISFYHVGVILKDGANIWLYHATPKGGVYRVNLAGENGLAWMRRYYGSASKGVHKYIQLVEVML